MTCSLAARSAIRGRAAHAAAPTKAAVGTKAAKAPKVSKAAGARVALWKLGVVTALGEGGRAWSAREARPARAGGALRTVRVFAAGGGHDRAGNESNHQHPRPAWRHSLSVSSQMRSEAARAAPRRRTTLAARAAVAAAARTRSIRAGHASIRAGHALVAFPRRVALRKTGVPTALIGVGARARVRPVVLRLVVAARGGHDRARNESEHQHPRPGWRHGLSVSPRARTRGEA